MKTEEEEEEDQENSTPTSSGKKTRRRTCTFRRVWNEARSNMELTADDLATKQSLVAKENGMRPPTLARRWIDSSGGRGQRKWPYRYVRRIDKEIRKLSKQIVRDCLLQNAPVSLSTLSSLYTTIQERSRLVKPLIIKT